jgi:hypothetical protein
MADCVANSDDVSQSQGPSPIPSHEPGESPGEAGGRCPALDLHHLRWTGPLRGHGIRRYTPPNLFRRCWMGRHRPHATPLMLIASSDNRGRYEVPMAVKGRWEPETTGKFSRQAVMTIRTNVRVFKSLIGNLPVPVSYRWGRVRVPPRSLFLTRLTRLGTNLSAKNGPSVFYRWNPCDAPVVDVPTSAATTLSQGRRRSTLFAGRIPVQMALFQPVRSGR